VKIPANGVGKPERLTQDGKVFRYAGLPSPDGQWIAYADKNQELWLFKAASKKTTLVAASKEGDFDDLAWSPDSQWLAYVQTAENTYRQIWIYRVAEDRATVLTSDRVKMARRCSSTRETSFSSWTPSPHLRRSSKKVLT